EVEVRGVLVELQPLAVVADDAAGLVDAQRLPVVLLGAQELRDEAGDAGGRRGGASARARPASRAGAGAGRARPGARRRVAGVAARHLSRVGVEAVLGGHRVLAVGVVVLLGDQRGVHAGEVVLRGDLLRVGLV